jgi:hypothetical protein
MEDEGEKQEVVVMVVLRKAKEGAGRQFNGDLETR